MTFEILFVLLALLGMVIALVLDKMRPGMVLCSCVQVSSLLRRCWKGSVIRG